MLCVSPMFSLLKLQQKTTLHTSHFINACSPEKNNKERPFSWPWIEAIEQRRRRVVNLNHSRTSTASSKTKHNMFMDSSQKHWATNYTYLVYVDFLAQRRHWKEPQSQHVTRSPALRLKKILWELQWTTEIITSKATNTQRLQVESIGPCQRNHFPCCRSVC